MGTTTKRKVVKKDEEIANKDKRRRSSVDIYDTKKSKKVVIDPNDYQVKKAAKRLRSMVKRQATNNNGNLKPSFEKFSNKNFSFSVLQFQSVLNDLHINLSDERVEALYNIIDMAGDGRVTFNEFKMFITESDSQISNKVKARGSSLRSLAAPKNTRGGGSSSSMKNSR